MKNNRFMKSRKNMDLSCKTMKHREKVTKNREHERTTLQDYDTIGFVFFGTVLLPAVAMWVPVHGAPASASAHGKAAAGGGRLPTRVGKEFVQGGFGLASTTLSARGQLK